ncbi:prostate-specific antigen-like [Schistocerca piceifrons]|uniref:prostate-specific antigen-like n=1 Tax=Schistocerca piceifrons TaxID=274613 RepID=UPI001F5F6543|nr:prostate-specific antigen-like [Schistocerca piceifrons]
MSSLCVLLILMAFTERLNVYGVEPPYAISGGSRLVGGQLENLPFMVLLVVRRVGVCSGSLVSMQWVVTAAHCIEHSRRSDIQLKAGYREPTDDDEQQQWEQERGCSELAVFPSHVRLLFDMGLVRSLHPFRESLLVNSLPLGRNWRFPRRGELCMAAGWQRANGTAHGTLYLLRYVLVHVLNSRLCQRHYGVRLHRGMLCAKAEEGKSLCFGDGGAPLVCRGLLLGVSKALVDADPARDELLKSPEQLQQVACGGNRTFMADERKSCQCEQARGGELVPEITSLYLADLVPSDTAKAAAGLTDCA